MLTLDFQKQCMVISTNTERPGEKDKLNCPSGVLDRCYVMTPFIHSPLCFAAVLLRTHLDFDLERGISL